MQSQHVSNQRPDDGSSPRQSPCRQHYPRPRALQAGSHDTIGTAKRLYRSRRSWHGNEHKALSPAAQVDKPEYEYPDFLNSDGDFVEFDSHLVPESDLEEGASRMLEVDNRDILPEINTH